MTTTSENKKPLKTKQVRCPTCGALPCDPCHSKQHHHSKNFHMSRIREAARYKNKPLTD